MKVIKKKFLAKRERKNEMRFVMGIIVININNGHGAPIQHMLLQQHYYYRVVKIIIFANIIRTMVNQLLYHR